MFVLSSVCIVFLSVLFVFVHCIGCLPQALLIMTASYSPLSNNVHSLFYFISFMNFVFFITMWLQNCTFICFNSIEKYEINVYFNWIELNIANPWLLKVVFPLPPFELTKIQDLGILMMVESNWCLPYFDGLLDTPHTTVINGHIA